MTRILRRPDVIRTKTHMCRFGMTLRDQAGEGLVLKPTSFMTNSPCVAKELNKQCYNIGAPESQKHRHVRLQNGRPAKAAIYPEALCKAICQGIKRQMLADKSG